MRKTLNEKKDKDIFLRLPVKPQTLFISKISVLMIFNYILAFTLVVPINLIFYLALDLNFTLVSNSAKSRGRYPSRIYAQEYEEDLIDLIKIHIGKTVLFHFLNIPFYKYLQ